MRRKPQELGAAKRLQCKSNSYKQRRKEGRVGKS